jgi:hypothetical protein
MVLMVESFRRQSFAYLRGGRKKAKKSYKKQPGGSTKLGQPPHASFSFYRHWVRSKGHPLARNTSQPKAAAISIE